MDTQYTNPTVWGPHFWFMFRCIANNYPDIPTEEDIINTKIFYTSFLHVLPCQMCKDSYIKHFHETPIDEYLTSKTKIIKWVNIIYENTNNAIKQQVQQKELSTHNNTPVKSCSSCGKKQIINENEFPQPNDSNSGINKGYIGGLRKVLSLSSIQNKYHILAFYNWIKYPHKIPSSTDALHIMHGYVLLKGGSPDNYYPSFVTMENKNISLIDNNEQILINKDTSYFIYEQFKKLSI
jgi:hypothetical protein